MTNSAILSRIAPPMGKSLYFSARTAALVARNPGLPFSSGLNPPDAGSWRFSTQRAVSTFRIAPTSWAGAAGTATATAASTSAIRIRSPPLRGLRPERLHDGLVGGQVRPADQVDAVRHGRHDGHQALADRGRLAGQVDD